LNKYILSYLAAIGLSSCGQVMMKAGALRTAGKHIVKTILNILSICGYLLFFAATLSSLYGLTNMPLKLGVAFLPLGYVIVGLLSYLFFGEKISPRKMFGTALIIGGAVVFNS